MRRFYRRRFKKRRRVFRRKRFFRRSFRKGKRRFEKKTRLTNRFTFANKGYAKLDYADHFILPASTANPFVKSYRTNSIYDPDVDLGGNAPMWKDTLSDVWARYRVRGCKYRIWMYDIGAAQAGSEHNIGVYHHQSDGTILPLDLITDLGVESAMVTKNAYVKFKPAALNPINRKPVIFKGYISHKHLVGDPATWAGRDYEAIMAANPAAIILTDITIANNAGATATTLGTTFVVWVKLRYYVEVFDRKTGQLA